MRGRSAIKTGAPAVFEGADMVTIMVRERSKLLCGGAEHQKSIEPALNLLKGAPYLQQFRLVIESLMHIPGNVVKLRIHSPVGTNSPLPESLDSGKEIEN